MPFMCYKRDASLTQNMVCATASFANVCVLLGNLTVVLSDPYSNVLDLGMYIYMIGPHPLILNFKKHLKTWTTNKDIVAYSQG